MHIPAFATKTFAVVGDLGAALLGGWLGSKVFGAAATPKELPRVIAREVGREMSGATQRRAAESAAIPQARLKYLVTTLAPHLDELLKKANQAGGLVNNTLFTEEQAWQAISTMASGLGEDEVILYLRHLDALVEDADVKGFIADLKSFHDDRILQRARALMVLAKENWPKIKAAAILADAKLAPVTAAHTNFNDWLREVNEREQRRWF